MEVTSKTLKVLEYFLADEASGTHLDTPAVGLTLNGKYLCGSPILQNLITPNCYITSWPKQLRAPEKSLRYLFLVDIFIQDLFGMAISLWQSH